MTAGVDPQILVLNCGSSSLKFGLFKAGLIRIETRVTGEVASVGAPGATFSAKDAQGREVSGPARFESQAQAIGHILKLLETWNFSLPAAVGHRIVHGGPRLSRHCLIDQRAMDFLETATPFAPLHIPKALEVIRATGELLPNVPQTACLDTSFHRSMPDVARTLPIPRTLEAEGIHRYGFHGLSCESIVHQFGSSVPERLIIAHLGNGASVTAVKGGRSVDTSMGLTPTGGVMMGTRSGDLDPGIVLYLMRQKGMNTAALEELLDRQSGLLGVSGVGSDMPGLRVAAGANPNARLAIDMFAYQVRKEIAGMIAVLGGVDRLVFTGGIGENDPHLRAAICQGLACMGVEPDPDQASIKPIHGPTPSGSIVVLPSLEDEQIARHTRALVHPEHVSR